MPSVRIPKEYNSATYFLTFIVKDWRYIFDRHNRFEILADSLIHCQKHKGLKLHAYVFMLNHIHLIAGSEDMIGFVRDFKKFTSKVLKQNIRLTEPKLLKIFQNRKRDTYEFWERSNMPKIIETEKFLEQKIDYIHMNPVNKQYVYSPEHWIWSSANSDSRLKVEPVLM